MHLINLLFKFKLKLLANFYKTIALIFTILIVYFHRNRWYLNKKMMILQKKDVQEFMRIDYLA